MNFFQPTNREELASALASLSGGSIVAGCTDFLAQRNGKVWHADTILSLTEMQELKQIELAGDSLAVGAVCVHSQVAQSPLVRQYFPALAMACSQVGCAQIRNRGTLGGSTATAYGRVALVICILAPLFLCATIFGVRERRDYNTKEVPPVSFKKIWNTITGNPQILWISLVFLLQQIGNDVVMGGLGSTYVYFAFGYEGGLYSLFNTVGLAATALLMIFYPMLAKRFRRKQMMDKLMLLSVIGYAVMIVSGLAMSGGMVKFWILTAGYMVANLGQYGFYLIMMISLINTVEYNEYLRGERDEAIITSLRPFFTKLASAIVVAVTSATYLIFGVTGYTNQISALERAASLGEIAEAEKLAQIDTIVSSIQPGQSRGLLLCLTVLPFVLMYASYVLYKKHYILDEDKYAEVCAELEKRRAEAK